jgi:membrane-associated PAP2 superfamily phosphatase
VSAQGRGFWLHQVVEYGIGGGVVFVAAQSSTPLAPILVGSAVVANAAITDGMFGAFKWIERRVHRYVDWVIIVVSLVLGVLLDLDSRARIALVGLALVLAVVTLGTNFVGRGSPRRGGTAAG